MTSTDIPGLEEMLKKSWRNVPVGEINRIWLDLLNLLSELAEARKERDAALDLAANRGTECDWERQARHGAEAQRDEAQSAREDLQRQVDELSVALAKAAAQFRFYESEHVNAGKMIKATTNGGMAEICEAAIAKSIEAAQAKGGEG